MSREYTGASEAAQSLVINRDIQREGGGQSF